MSDPTLSRLAGLGDAFTVEGGNQGPGWAKAIQESLMTVGETEEDLMFRGRVPAAAIPIFLRLLHRADLYRKRHAAAKARKQRLRLSDLQSGAKTVGRALALSASIDGRRVKEAVEAFGGSSAREQRFQANRGRDKFIGRDGGDE